MMTQGNLFWGNHLDYFCIKFRSMDAQVLFRSFHTKIIQSTTAISSIVVAFATNLKKSSLRDLAKPNQGNPQKNKIDCHDFATQNLAMTGEYSSLRGRIVDSHKAIHITKIKDYK